MLGGIGVALLSQTNEIIHLFGNSEFHRWTQKVDDTSEDRHFINRRSTSGISSSSTTSLEQHVDDKCARGADRSLFTTESKVPTRVSNARSNNKAISSPELDARVVGDKLLPLILLHRTKSRLEADWLEEMESESINFKIIPFLGNNLLVLITSSDLPPTGDIAQLYLDCVKRCLTFHYGQALNLIQAGSPGLARIRSRVHRRMLRLAQNFDVDKPSIHNELFNLNSMFANGSELRGLVPHLRGLTQRITMSLGRRCRCFFVNSGSLVASLQCPSPDTEPLPTAVVMNHEDVGSLLEFALLPSDGYSQGDKELDEGGESLSADRRCLKCQVEQAWVFSKLLNRRQLLNVFVLSLSGELELICLVNADYAALIGALCDLMEVVGDENAYALQQPLTTSNTPGQRIDKLVHRALMGLRKFRPALPTNSYMFLSNMERTSKLLTSHWDRLKSRSSSLASADFSTLQPYTLYSLCGDNLDLLTNHLRVSLTRIGSSLSIFSGSSLHSQPRFQCRADTSSSTYPSATSTWHSNSGAVSGMHMLSNAHRDAMKSQFLRFLRNLTGELLNYSYAAARLSSLKKLHSTVRQSMGREMGNAIEAFAGRVVKSRGGGSPLRPAALGFDMLAYKFSSIMTRFNFHYVPEKFRAVFSKIDTATSGQLGNGARIVREVSRREGYLVVQIPNPSSRLDDEKISRGQEHLKPGGEKGAKIKPGGTAADGTVIVTDYCLALFPDYVNVRLAVKQTRALACLLEGPLRVAMRNLM